MNRWVDRWVRGYIVLRRHQRVGGPELLSLRTDFTVSVLELVLFPKVEYGRRATSTVPTHRESLPIKESFVITLPGHVLVEDLRISHRLGRPS